MDDGRVLWISGAGSGMGRAVAVAAASRGARVALSGRRADAVAETGRLVEGGGGRALVLPLDARDGPAVLDAHDAIVRAWGGVTDLVVAAGLNSPARSWRDQSLQVFTDIVDTNLTAAVQVISAVLPEMRGQRTGHVVVVSSYSAWRFSPGAGVAYTASKAALAAVCRTLNDQEAASGIRACHLCPGDVDTGFLELRPEVPDETARRLMLTPEDIAAAVLFVLDVPPHVRIDELVISPLAQT